MLIDNKFITLCYPFAAGRGWQNFQSSSHDQTLLNNNNVMRVCAINGFPTIERLYGFKTNVEIVDI